MLNHALDRVDILKNMIPLHNHNDSDSNCPASLSKVIDIKISSLIIIQLKYDSIMTQYSNWLADLKTAFNRDPAKFPISCQKIILMSMILNK